MVIRRSTDAVAREAPGPRRRDRLAATTLLVLLGCAAEALVPHWKLSSGSASSDSVASAVLHPLRRGASVAGALNQGGPPLEASPINATSAGLTSPPDNLGPQPRFPINQEVLGWTLLGYDIDDTRLTHDGRADLTLYWVSPGNVAPLESLDFRRLWGRLFVQVLRTVRNRVLDGGFERGSSALGFPGDIYDAAPAARRLLKDVRDGEHTTVAMLRNTPSIRHSSFASPPIPMDPRKLYLRAAWLRGEGAHMYFGGRWAPSGDYSYVVGEASPRRWTHYAQVIQPPPGVTASAVWLLNVDSTGAAYFDDVVVVELGDAAPAACGDAGKLVTCGPPILAERAAAN